MSIKNDKWIITQSIAPRFVALTESLEVAKPYTIESLHGQRNLYFSHDSEEELRAKVKDREERLAAGSLDIAPGVVEYRAATEADLAHWRPMIEPFEGRQVREVGDHLSSVDPDEPHREWQLGDAMESYRIPGKKVISYGVSSFGYDVRIARQFKIFTNINTTVVDPKNFDDRSFVDFEGDVCIIPPNSFVLASSLEYFRMPRNVSGLVLGKSTYARCGINCIATPLEPGWEGHITLEFANTTPLPAKLYAHEGAAQVQFFEGEQPLVSYADRGGKYQGQRGITLPKA